MKKLISALAVLLGLNSYANNTLATFSNDQGCQINVIDKDDRILIDATKEDKDTEKSAKIWIYKDFHDAYLTEFCNNLNQYNSEIKDSDKRLTINCYNKKASVAMDIDFDFNMSYLSFKGHHTYFFWEVDDSFLCTNLRRNQ